MHVECFLRFCFVVKTSADNVILPIFDIFTYELSLFSTQLSFYALIKSIGLEKRLNSLVKMSKICQITLSADVFDNESKPRETFHCDLSQSWSGVQVLPVVAAPISYHFGTKSHPNNA